MAPEREQEKKPKRGKRNNQKLKPYLVMQYLLRYSDADNVKTAFDIVDFLERCGIAAERRSIYRDIEDINKVYWLMENKEDVEDEEDECGIDIVDAETALAEGCDKLIIYDKRKKGFYVRERHYDITDIRLLAESVYSAKFLSESQSKRLVDVVCEFFSKYQAKQIRHDAILVNRVRTKSTTVLNNIKTINEAMSRTLEGRRHEPEKISFQYQTYSIKDMEQRVERRNGGKYIVSPYKLLINDGYYYLLAFSDKFQEMRTYRVDRMKGVERQGSPRDGAEAFEAIDMQTYTQRVFSMYGGRKDRVTIRFINPLLDAVVDRFGTDRGVIYESVDDRHFTVTTWVEVSSQFFGWVLGFGNKAKILGSEQTVQEFAEYVKKVVEMY